MSISSLLSLVQTLALYLLIAYLGRCAFQVLPSLLSALLQWHIQLVTVRGKLTLPEPASATHDEANQEQQVPAPSKSVSQREHAPSQAVVSSPPTQQAKSANHQLPKGQQDSAQLTAIPKKANATQDHHHPAKTTTPITKKTQIVQPEERSAPGKMTLEQLAAHLNQMRHR